MWDLIPSTKAALEVAYQGGHVWDLIPLTKAALEVHVKRAAYQGGCVGSDIGRST